MWFNFSLGLVWNIHLYLLKTVQGQPPKVSEARSLEPRGPARTYCGLPSRLWDQGQDPGLQSQCSQSRVTQASLAAGLLGSSMCWYHLPRWHGPRPQFPCP